MLLKVFFFLYNMIHAINNFQRQDEKTRKVKQIVTFIYAKNLLFCVLQENFVIIINRLSFFMFLLNSHEHG
jgi:hypothetical protein